MPQQTPTPPSPSAPAVEAPQVERELLLVQVMNGIAFSAAVMMFTALWLTFLDLQGLSWTA